MWIVTNQLKGVLRFPGLNIEIPPEGEFDLDGIGREKAEASQQIKIALENGYLRTVRRTMVIDESEFEKIIEQRIQSIKSSLVTEINDLYREKTAAQA